MVPEAAPLFSEKSAMLSLFGSSAGLRLSTSATSPVGVPPVLVTLVATVTLWPCVMFRELVAPLSWRDDAVAVKLELGQLLTIWVAITLPSPLARS